MIGKTGRKQAQILNIGVDSTSKQRVLAFVQDSVARGYKFYIVTPNSEIVLEASRDLELLRILNGADLATADSIGLAIAHEFLSMKKVSKPLSYLIYPIQWLAASFNRGRGMEESLTVLKGREVFVELVKLANSKKWRVFLFGGEKGAAEKAKENLHKTFKSVTIETGEPGMYGKNGEPVSDSDIAKEIDIVNHINNFKPHLLFVALNTPKQEKFIDRLLPKLNVGGAMTVGGTFNYIAGYSKLPPKGIGDSGFEWLWRLFAEPWRIKRILNAVVVFPLKVIASKIK